MVSNINQDNHIPIFKLRAQHDGPQHDEDFQVYKRRWFILLMYSFATFINAAVWITFAPISPNVAVFFNVSESSIDVLTSLFVVTFIPGILISLYISRAAGVAATFKVGSLLMAFGTLIRLCTYFISGQQYPTVWFVLMFVGQLLPGLAQPLLTTLSAQIAQNWFAPGESIIAVFVGSLCNPLGIALGSLFSRKMITVSPTVGDGVDYILLTHGLCSAVVLILGVIFFEERPPTAPSALEAAAIKEQENDALLDANTQGFSIFKFAMFIFKPIFKDIKTLLKLDNFNFLKLCVAFSLGMMLFNVIVSLPAKIITPCNQDYNPANMLTIIICCGLVGCIVYSVLMEMTKQYNAILKIGFVLAATSFISFLLVLDNTITSQMLTIMFVILGVFMIPLLPLTIECAQEMCYPHSSPQVINAVVLSFGQLPSILGLFVFMKLLTLSDYTSCTHPVFSAFGISSITLLATVVALIMLYNGKNNRTAAKAAIDGHYVSLPEDEFHDDTDEENNHVYDDIGNYADILTEPDNNTNIVPIVASTSIHSSKDEIDVDMMNPDDFSGIAEDIETIDVHLP